MTWTSSSNQSDDFVHDTGRLANASRVPASNTRYDNDDINRTRFWSKAAKQRLMPRAVERVDPSPESRLQSDARLPFPVKNKPLRSAHVFRYRDRNLEPVLTSINLRTVGTLCTFHLVRASFLGSLHASFCPTHQTIPLGAPSAEKAALMGSCTSLQSGHHSFPVVGSGSE